MHSSRTGTKIARVALIGVVAIVALVPAAPVAAQHCIEWTQDIVDTSYTCVTEPWIDRMFDAKTFRWNDEDYLMANLGNELRIWKIDSPEAPKFIDESRFKLGNRGDSDYDLIGFSICDNCRFGVFTHKLVGTVVFDLGAGSVPDFSGHQIYDTDESESGGLVFSVGDPGPGFQQYLIAKALPNRCEEGGTLYTIDGAADIKKIDCIVDPTGDPWTPGNIYPMKSGGVDYLIAGAGAEQGHVVKLTGAGANLIFDATATISGLEMRGSFFSLDPKKKIAASANVLSGDVSFWDLSNPLSASRISAWTIDADLKYNVVSLRSPTVNGPAVLFLDKKGYFNETRTYMVEASGPREFENEYWTDLSLPHNEWLACAFNAGGTLSPDGSALYLSRSALGMVFDLDECLDPEPAVAGVSASPLTAFPGQSVTVSDTTDGSYDKWAVWVTEEPGGSLVAGVTTPEFGNPHSVEFTVDEAIAEGVSFTGHIEVGHSTLTPNDPTDTVNINVDRAPRASFTITPEAYIINDTITMTASAEAAYAVESYNWVITPPISSSFTRTGSVIQIDLDEGDSDNPWTVVLTVNYQHAASEVVTEGDDRYGNLEGNGVYEYETSQTIPVSSVGAAFYVSPSSPYHNAAFDLRSTSVAAGGSLVFDWDVYNGARTSVVDPLTTTCDGPGDVDDVCRISGDTLLPGIYDIRLMLNNGTDFDTAWVDNVVVRDGNIQVDFSISESLPEIGEAVSFTINGIDDVGVVEWDFGDTGCNGTARTSTCFIGNCLSTVFTYADSGPKNVTLKVFDEAGTQLGESVTHTLTVQTSGSCEEDPPDETCDFSLSPDRITVGPDPDDKTRSFTVSTGRNCDWTAQSNSNWIHITSGASGSGSSSVQFRFDTNYGNSRNGSITVAGKETFTLTQDHAAVDYFVQVSNRFPEIGEVVTFNAHPYLTVASWDFGGKNCKGQDPRVNCLFGSCNQMSWNFRNDGDKTVTIHFEGMAEPITKSLTVKSKGECCQADGAPTASILSDAKGSEAYVGQTVAFSDAFAKASALKVGTPIITWSPTVPEIGQNVEFEITGITGDVQADWNFGGPGCTDDSNFSCTPIFGNCHTAEYKYAESGEMTVSVTVTDGDGSLTDEVTVTVADTGSCGGGGGGDPVCTYSLNPDDETFTNLGGTGTFNVYTKSECDWTATSNDDWISFEPVSGTGTSTISYTVEPNDETEPRTGTIDVMGRDFDVIQSADPGNVSADDWHWEITLETVNDQGIKEDVVVYESATSESIISYRFAEIGTYDIRLWASNCAGAALDKMTLTVVEAPIEDFVVSSALTLPGSNGTQWESDFRFYNPCGELLDVSLEYQPQGETNTGLELQTYPFQLQPGQTRVFDSLKEAIPDLVGEELVGSIRIMSSSASGCKVVSVSRTFNDTDEGPLGLTVPALPVLPTEAEAFHLTGLVSNDQYRTNIRLVNYGDKDAWVTLKLLTKQGESIGDKKNPIKVKGHSTRQVNDITTWMGVEEDLAPFTVRAEIASGWVEAFSTVIDNVSGDSVLFMSTAKLDDKLWLPGVIHMGGVGGAFWKTDLWMHNPTDDPWLTAEGIAIAGGKPENRANMNLAALKAGAIKQKLDVAAEFVAPGDEVSGYIVFTGLEGDPVPQVSARTYTSDGSGGTYGINVRPYTADDLLWPGEKGYIAGIANSADLDTGYRTNVGLLNTDTTRGAKVKITVFNLDGSLAAEPIEVFVNKEKLIQFDLFAKLGIKHVTMVGSVEIEVLNGSGGFGVYATEISNLSQDAIFIPAQRPLFGAPAEPVE